MKSVNKSKTSTTKNTRIPKAYKATIEKRIRKYRLKDAEKQEEEDLKYWASVSISEKTEMAYSLWEECYWIQKGVNINAQRLRRVLEIAKLPQS
ncbi:MAG: hypothetical protein L3J17_08570 [Candidatus Jettenia sp.]|nr:MAG: hypothetical protein L3J17_08570 [Candidatus Jettenia sp.]